MPSYRIAKLNSLIAKYLEIILIREIELPPNIFPSIVKVDTTNDLEHTKVSVSAIPVGSRARTLHFLENHVGRIRKLLSEKLKTYKCPQLHFTLDKSLDQAERIEKLISQIHEKSPSGNIAKKTEPDRDSHPHSSRP